MQAQHVRPSTQRVHALDVLTPLGDVGPAVPIVIQHAHGKGVYEAGEDEADSAEPQDAEGARAEVVCVARGDGGVPGARVEGAFGF